MLRHETVLSAQTMLYLPVIYLLFEFYLSFQSTYCSTMIKHSESVNRSVQVVNLDPAAEHFDYPVMAGEYSMFLLS